MPFQQVQLDQSIYNKQKPKWGAGRQPQRSPVSEALTPQPGGMTTEQRYAGNYVLDQMRAEEAKEAERKYNEKMMKMQHEQAMEKLKFATAAKQDAQKQQTTMGNVISQAQQQGAQKQQIEDNPEPSAKAMYDLIKSMPDDTQNVLLNQLFTPTQPAGGITSAGRGVAMPEKYNPIASVFLSKGWATIDKAGKPVLSDPEREFEEGTFKTELIGGRVIKTNTATGETETLFIPESVYFPSSKAAMKGTPDYDEFDKKPVMIKKGEWKVEYVKKGAPTQTPEEEMTEWNTKQFGTFKRHMLSGINDLGFMIDPKSRDKYLSMTYGEYMQFMQGETPDRFGEDVTDTTTGESVTSNNLFDSILAKVGLQVIPKETKGAGKPAFNEENVNNLVSIFKSDTITDAQRADLITQGATDVDIDEALRRKKVGSIGEK